jgi:hypothetical protein
MLRRKRHRAWSDDLRIPSHAQPGKSTYAHVALARFLYGVGQCHDDLARDTTHPSGINGTSLLFVAMGAKLITHCLQTQCIAGASIGVGLANRDWRCINMRLVGWIYFGWVITVPITALISGMLMGLILNAPRW